MISTVHLEAAARFKTRAKRRVDEILWHRGVLEGKLHAGQEKIEAVYKRSIGKLFVADCARQFGKTTWCAIKDIEKALTKRRAKIRVGTAFLTDLEQFIIPAFEFILEDCPLELRPKWNSQKYSYTFPSTGAEIRLVGLDRKPNGLRGNKLDQIDLQEAGFISNLRHLYQYVLVPATTHVPDAKILMTSTQPDSPDHDFNSFCDEALDAGSYVQLDVYQNPLLSEADIDRLAKEVGGKDSVAFQREYLCKRVVDVERAIVPEFSKSLIVERLPTEFDQFYHRYLWMDIGVQKDLTVVFFVLYDFREAYAYVEDEIVIRGPEVTTAKIRDAIRLKLTDSAPHLKLYSKSYRNIADNSHPLLLNDLATDVVFPLYFTATDKEKLHEMVNTLRMFVGARRLRAHPRCVHFAGSMLSGIWDKNRKEFARSPIYGHADGVAAAVYGVRNLDQVTNPVPRNYGLDLDNVFLSRQQPRLSPLAKTLAEAFKIKPPKR